MKVRVGVIKEGKNGRVKERERERERDRGRDKERKKEEHQSAAREANRQAKGRIQCKKSNLSIATYKCINGS